VIPQGSGAIPPEDRPLHVLNRLGFGPRPGDIKRVRSIGVERYIREQLNPESVPEPPALAELIRNFDTLHMTPVELFIRFQAPLRRLPKGDKEARKEIRGQARVIIQQAAEARLVRAIEGPRHLQEVMTAFWFNHFNVFAGKGLDHLWIGAYEEEAIRPHTMGEFRTLLGATAKHPAMLFYLDNWQNTAPNSPGRHGRFEGINENYAREVMELHTLGVNGGYTQADVIALAHIFTGWGLPRRRPMRRPLRRFFGRLLERENERPAYTDYGFYFDASRHDFTDKVFLGRHIRGAGVSEGEQALDMLAQSPATANHLSFELAQYFVADDPPRELVGRMAARYLKTGGDIRAVLETLFFSAEFWDRRHYRNKFKTPYEFVISSVRATGTEVRNYRPLAGAMAMLGMPLYGCQTPNGYRDTQEAWLNPDGMMMRLSFATALGAGRLPLGHPVFDDDLDGNARMRAGRTTHIGFEGGRMGAMNRDALETRRFGFRMQAPAPGQLETALGDSFSATTRTAVEDAPAPLRAPLILGSPKFMMR
jgi:uncharacterized protein (DUF1800 family)